jgi:hypothetical protein
LKLLQVNIEKALEDIRIGNYFLSRTSVAPEIRQMGFYQIKKLWCIKETITRIKRQSTEWEKKKSLPVFNT